VASSVLFVSMSLDVDTAGPDGSRGAGLLSPPRGSALPADDDAYPITNHPTGVDAVVEAILVR
jgi:hypothetical protein